MSVIFTVKQLRQKPKRIEAVFFEAMCYGHASSRRPFVLHGLPWSQGLLYTDGHWRVTDTWETSEWSRYSGGVTRIYYNGNLIWMMHYFGAYSEEAIPCLKAALLANYQKSLFFGGRGPDRFTFGEFTYHNWSKNKSSSKFENFSGEEMMFHERGDHRGMIGEHRYHGGLMI